MNKFQKAFNKKTSLKEFYSLAEQHKKYNFTQSQLARLIWLQEVIWQAIIDRKLRYSYRLAKTKLVFEVRKIWNWRKQSGTKYTIKPALPFFRTKISIEPYLTD
jgi:hypothetical protein